MALSPAVRGGEIVFPTGGGYSGFTMQRIDIPEKFKQRSNFWIFLSLAIPYLFIALTVMLFRFDVALKWPLAFLCLLAAHRCFQTMVHDASHLFFSKKLKINDFISNYFVAGLTGTEIKAYRRVHLDHHKFNGGSGDPESEEVKNVIESIGVLGAIVKYITLGRVGYLLQRYYLGKKQKQKSGKTLRQKLSSKLHVVTGQLFLILVFHFAAENIYLYGIWAYQAVSWSPLLSYLRFLVEHPMVEGKPFSTRTTYANPIELLFFAPYGFNYHCEHHLMPAVPPYRLRGLHQFLKENSEYQEDYAINSGSYIETLVRTYGTPQ